MRWLIENFQNEKTKVSSLKVQCHPSFGGVGPFKVEADGTEYVLNLKRELSILNIKASNDPIECNLAIEDVHLKPADNLLEQEIEIFFSDSIDPLRFKIKADLPEQLFSKSKGIAKEKNLASPINGKVIRILKKNQDLTGEGETILIIEAMKMENQIKSPISGKIVNIAVTEGQLVNVGQALCMINSEG